jgi:hypothetical protein
MFYILICIFKGLCEWGGSEGHWIAVIFSNSTNIAAARSKLQRPIVLYGTDILCDGVSFGKYTIYIAIFLVHGGKYNGNLNRKEGFYFRSDINTLQTKYILACEIMCDEVSYLFQCCMKICV